MMKNCSLKCQDEELLQQDSEVEYSWKWLFDENSDEQADEFDQFKENDDDPVTIIDEDLFGKLLTKLFINVNICLKCSGKICDLFMTQALINFYNMLQQDH